MAERFGQDQSIGEIVTRELSTVDSSSTVMDAARLMRDNDTGAIIVTDGGSMRGLVGENGKPVGVISLGDLAMERDEESALADISAASPNN